MRVIFHIGTKKTGTTSLQKSFTNARETLKENGVFYPSISHYPHHTHLLFADCGDEEFPGQFGRTNPSRIEESRTKSLNMWSHMLTDFEKSGCDTLLLSSEYVFYLPPETLNRLVSRLRGISERVEFVGYLRSPADYYLSLLQQDLKFGDQIASPVDDTGLEAQCRYLSALPLDRLVLRAFNRRQLKGGCIVRDFVSIVLGLREEIADQIPVVTSNESIGAEGMSIMQSFNQYHFPGQRRPGRPLNKLMVVHLTGLEGKTKTSRPELLPHIQALIEANCRAEANSWRDQFGISFADFPYETGELPSDILHNERLKDRHWQLPELIRLRWDQVDDVRNALLFQLADELAQLQFDQTGDVRTIPAGKRHPIGKMFLQHIGLGPDVELNRKGKWRRRVLWQKLARLKMDEREIDQREANDLLVEIYNRLYRALMHQILQAQKAEQGDNAENSGGSGDKSPQAESGADGPGKDPDLSKEII